MLYVGLLWCCLLFENHYLLHLWLCWTVSQYECNLQLLFLLRILTSGSIGKPPRKFIRFGRGLPSHGPSTNGQFIDSSNDFNDKVLIFSHIFWVFLSCWILTYWHKIMAQMMFVVYKFILTHTAYFQHICDQLFWFLILSIILGLFIHLLI